MNIQSLSKQMDGLGCFANTFCMPVWLEDEYVATQRSTPLKQSQSPLAQDFAQPCPPENSIVSLTGSATVEESRDSASLATENRSQVVETVRRELEAAQSMEVSQEDLDDVITRIVRRRNELQRECNFAHEEIKRLELENQNLKNLNAINKRLNQSQKEQVQKLKIEVAESSRRHREQVEMMEKERMADQEKIQELKKAFHKMKSQTLEAKNALDDFSFFWGFSEHSVPSNPIDVTNLEEKEQQLHELETESSPVEESTEKRDSSEEQVPSATSGDALDKLFAWTMGD